MKEKKKNITVKSNYCRLDSKKCVRLNPNNHFGWYFEQVKSSYANKDRNKNTKHA